MAASDVVLAIFNGFQGIVLCVANGLLLSAILLGTSLRKRKEMLIIAGMAGADFIYGLGNFTLNIYRLSVLLHGQQREPTTAWDCMTVPAVSITFIGLQLTSVMNFVLSCDRLFAISRPIQYRSLNGRYAGNVLAAVALFALASLLAMFLTTYFGDNDAPINTKMCGVAPFTYSYTTYHYSLIAVASFVSVALYVLVFITYCSTMSTVTPSNTTINDQRAIAQQRRLTVTIGIISISTTIFFFIPSAFLAVFAWFRIAFTPTQSVVLGTMLKCSTVINVAIYVYRQTDVRREIVAIITCKKAQPMHFVWVSVTGDHRREVRRQ